MNRARAIGPLLSLSLLLGACGGGGGDSPTPDASTPPVDGGAPDGSGEAGLSCGDSAQLPAGVTTSADGRTFELACPRTPLTVSIVDEGIARLLYARARSRRSYAVSAAPRADLPVRGGSRAGRLVVCGPAVTVEVSTEDCRVRVQGEGGALLADESGAADGFFKDAEGVGVLRRAAPQERYYGFGLRTGASLDRRGRVLTTWNTDVYDDSVGGFRPDVDALYESIPFFIGLRDKVAYGVFSDVTFRQRFDMGKTDPERYSIRADGGELDEYVIAGPTMRDVLRRYTALTGRMPMPPRWALGFQQSRWDSPCAGSTPDKPFCAASSVAQLVRTFRDKKIPLDAVYLDIQHMDRLRSFTWDPVRFPDPAGLTADLAALGVKTIPIIDPGLSADPSWDVYADGLARGYYLTRGGAAHIGAAWPGPVAFPDFSAPAVHSFWGALLAKNAQRGARGAWIDLNEPADMKTITVPNDVSGQGDGQPVTMAEFHNVYGLEEARATYDGLRAATPAERPFVLTRAAYAGTQRYAATWTGDAPSDFTTLEMTLPMILGEGLSGVAFTGSDVGGYSGRSTSTPELFARWMALGSLSPLFRAHAEQSARRQELWAFGPEVEIVSREAVGARYELLPYLYSVFREAHETGAPIVRPLVYEFQDDAATHTMADQGMLGPSILFAPIVSSGKTSRRVYLPAGRWFDLASGAIAVAGKGGAPAGEEAGRYVDTTTDPEPLPLAAFPVYVREGAIVPRTDRAQWTGERPLDPLRLDVYPGSHTGASPSGSSPGDKPSSFTLYEDDGLTHEHERGAFSKVTYTLARTQAGAVLKASPREGSWTPPKRRLVVRLRRADADVSAVRLDGRPLTRGAEFTWDAEDRAIVVTLEDRAPFELALDYDARVTEAAPTVKFPLTVRVPAGTPRTTPIHVVTSTTGWSVQQPLAWSTEPDTASGTVEIPRGSWFFFKFTRGGWTTVEKTASCGDRANRYTLARPGARLDATVDAWADRCP